MRRLFSFVLGLLLAIYPICIFFSLKYLQPRYIGLFILIVIIARFATEIKRINLSAVGSLLPVTAAGTTVCLLVLIFNQQILIMLFPTLINLVLFMTFSFSLVRPPSMVERIARLTEPDLSEEAINYTRNVTVIWVIFFLINGTIATYTTFYTSIEVWTLYNGLIAYLLMGLIFGIEYTVRMVLRREA